MFTQSSSQVDQPWSFLINAGIHTLILLTFLTVLFFTYISKLTEEHIDSALQQLIVKNTNQLMTNVKNQDTQGYIQWPIVRDVSALLETQYQGDIASIQEANKKLEDNTICAIVIFFVVIVIIALYFYKRGYNLHLKILLVENIITFMLVGVIELFFFQNIAAKYIPVLPSDVTLSLMARIKENLLVY